MKTETYDKLKKLHLQYKPQEFGKICQKLLAISFQKVGYSHIIERSIQGVDIDVANEKGEKYAIEVKTSVNNSVIFETKDAYGLQQRKKDGYQPVLAALELKMFSSWAFIKANDLKPGKHHINLLVPRIYELEDIINPLFDQAVKEHFKDTLDKGQKYLNEILIKGGAEVRE